MNVKEIGTPINGPALEQGGVKRPSGDFVGKLEAAFTQGRNAFDHLFQVAGQQFQVPPALLKAIAWAESGFNPHAVSRAGAQGIMQLMPGTARSLGVTDPFNPAQNIFGAARYLRSLLDRFQGDIKLALAAYNAGPGAVQRYGGIPPYRETREYVKRVLAFIQNTGVNPAANQAGATPPQFYINEAILQAATLVHRDIPEWVKLWAEALLAEAVPKIE